MNVQPNLYMQTDGKYLYRFPNNRLNVDQFNRDFEQYKIQSQEYLQQKLNQKLVELNQPEVPIAIYNQPIGTILIGTKDTVYNIMDDLMNFQFNTRTFTKDNRMFFIGILLLFIGLLIYLYDLLIGIGSKDNNNITKIIIDNYSNGAKSV